ncbi:MAG: SoxR reducing system RseC family protein [Vibrionaceae bacterium]
MSEQFTAIATVKEVTNGQVLVSCQPQSACHGCALKRGCANGLAASNDASQQLYISCDEALEAGEQVEISVEQKFLLRTAALVYLLPLICMLLGAFFTQWMGASEPFVIAAALLFGGGGFFAAKWRLSALCELKPLLLRKI